MSKTCPTCGEGFSKLGLHWRYNSSHRPELTDRQREIATGILMGDGSLNRQGTAHLTCECISPNYLEYVSDAFENISNGVSLKHNSSESAERARNSGFRPNADSSNYQDLYRWRTCCHPEFEDMAEWYSSGEKIWPEDIELSPTVLKHWYVGDGNLEVRGNYIRITIGLSNEIDNKDKIVEMFDNVGLPEPKFVDYQGDSGRVGMARFNVSESKTLLDYMGEPLPDFEYKWRDV